MFEGKMLRELAGMPIRRIDLANSALALAEPDPLTLANLTTKSLTLSMQYWLDRATIIPLLVHHGGHGEHGVGSSDLFLRVLRELRGESFSLAAAACGSGH